MLGLRARPRPLDSRSQVTGGVTWEEAAMKPTWLDDVPVCASDACPSFDGKRCRETGFKPDRICEPAVLEAISLLRKWNGDKDAVYDDLSIAAQTTYFIEEGPGRSPGRRR